MFFFGLFSIFTLLTPFYLPGLIFINATILKILFLTAFGILLVISAVTFYITFEINGTKEKYKKLLYFWVAAATASWLNLIIFINPNGHNFLGDNPVKAVIALSITAVLIGWPFFLASFTFIKKALQTEAERMKYFLLGLSFLLIVMGGPLHQFGFILAISILADVVTSLGFISAFLALTL
jgi:uncharacterized membrane protein YjjP (DUF1212 family)